MRRLTLALAASVPLCAGALLAPAAHAAPTVESDENGPLVQIIKPGYNDVLKGKYRILIQVTARKYNPQSVEMFIDDKSASNGPMPISSFASSSYDFPTTSWPEGRHKLTVRVTDSQGFRGWSETTIFINNKGAVDTKAPDLRRVGIDPLQEFSGSMKIEVDAADNFGVKMLQISINAADSPNKPVYSWLMNQPPYKVNLDTIGKNIPDGLYVLKALAFDSLDQQGEAPPLTIGVVNDQINATRVEDMLEGQRQMQRVLQGKTPVENAGDKNSNSAQNAPATPAKTNSVATPESAAPKAVAPKATVPTPAQTAAPRVTPPAVEIPQQTSANPGIQLPLVKTPETPAIETPVEATVANETTAPEMVVEESAIETPAIETPASETAVTETAVTETAATETPATQASGGEASVSGAEVDSRAADATATSVAPETTEIENRAATSAQPAASVAPTEIEASSPTLTPERTLIAKAPSLPVGQRNAGEASLSRAAAIEAAMTPASRGVASRSVALGGSDAAPIAVARFSHPHLSGRAITGMPAWSQNATGDDSRLSNAELSRGRAAKTRVLNVSRAIAAQNADTGASTSGARAFSLQTSAPIAAQSPLLARKVTANSVSTPAPKLTRQAQNQATPLAGSRASISKAVPVNQRAKPIEIAPVLVAKNNDVAGKTPQMSAPTAPRMSESASGLSVPSRLAKAVQRLTGKNADSMNGERVAALPRPDAARRDRSSSAIVAVPLDEPLQIADTTVAEIPASYRAERNTTLRAIAARFGLPVELVAISNNWTSEMKVLRGMEVKLPRPLQVSYNGAPVTGDAPSMLMGDTAVTAFRFMFEKTGGKLEWDATNHRVIARKDNREITLTIGSNVAKVGDREVMMELAAFLFQGRTMVPLRFFEEGMNAQVEWNPQTGRLVVAMAG